MEHTTELRSGVLRPRTALVRGAVLTLPLVAVVAAVALLVPGAGHRLHSADPAWLASAVALEACALASYALSFARNRNQYTARQCP